MAVADHLHLPGVILAGCGYVGEPLPPALRRPVPVTDLSAVEHASKILIQFTVPKTTTEDLDIKDTPDIELRVGPKGNGFQLGFWMTVSDRIANISQDNGAAKAEVDVAKYAGQTVVVGVNVHGPGGRSAGWSNFTELTVVPPLGQPEGFELSDGPDQVQLKWRAEAPEFRVFRKTVEAINWTRIGVSTKPEYADTTIEYGQTYQYYVQGQQKSGDGYAESEGSEVRTIKPVDVFPPAVPTGLTVQAGTGNMELVWERNTEKDFAAYRIYKDGKLLSQGLTSPAFSDPDVQPGTKYQYQISALDTAGNESAKCASVQAELP